MKNHKIYTLVLLFILCISTNITEAQQSVTQNNSCANFSAIYDDPSVNLSWSSRGFTLWWRLERKIDDNRFRRLRSFPWWRGSFSDDISSISADNVSYRLKKKYLRFWPPAIKTCRSKVISFNLDGNNPPVAVATSPAETTSGQTIILDGSASSDPDGNTLTYSWQVVSAPDTVAIASPSSSTTDVTLGSKGTYVFSLTVSDGELTDTVNTQTIVINSAPTASISYEPLEFFIGDEITIDGGNSSDIDGDSLTYSWSIQLPTDSSSSLTNSNSDNTSFTPDNLGDYVITLVVSDGEATDTTQVTLIPTNRAPIANAGPDQTAKITDIVTLDGSSSSDPDGSEITYFWTIVSKPDGSVATLTDSSAVMPQLTIDKPGSYDIQLEVSDGEIGSDSDLVIIDTINSAPVANAGDDQTGFVGDEITLGGANSSDVDGDELSYSWSFTSKPLSSTATFDNNSSVSPKFTLDKAGEYRITLIVSDGEFSSEEDIVIVSTLNSAPVANAGVDQVATVGSTSILDGSGSSDVDGDPLSFNWSLLSKPDGSVSTLDAPTTSSPSLNIDKSGTYIAQLTVSDGELSSASDTTMVTTANIRPVANIEIQGASTVFVGEEVSFSGSNSSDADGDILTYSWSIISKPEGSTAELGSTDTVNTVLSLDIEGEYVVQLIVNDGELSSLPTTASATGIPLGTGPLIPNPEDVAPPVDETVPTTTYEATKFIYTGEEKIQLEVNENTIVPSKAAVVRGVVINSEDSTPLAGVRVSIKDTPEFGYTFTRSDGEYDLVINGGGDFVINFSKEGYLSSQRRVDVSYGEYEVVEEVALVAKSSVASSVTLSDPGMKVAQGPVETDTDGTRRAVALIPEGINAMLISSSGTQTPLTDLTFRITEYTVGESGEASMPGPLPPQSAYTYAVDISLDEETEDTLSVSFSDPIYVHVDNFLGFKPGSIVPVGYYDDNRAIWVPSENGVVIGIVGEAAGIATVSFKEDLTPATQAELDLYGVTSAELEKLSELYNAGDSTWRFATDHLTPWDCNWPYGPPDDAESPNQKEPDDKDDPDDDDDPDDPCKEAGSVIRCESQALDEVLSISGTPYSLIYKGDQVVDRKDRRTLEIPLTSENIPSSLKRIKLELSIAGQRYVYSYPAETNLSYTFVWEGLNPYGELVFGKQDLSINIGYVYDGVYLEPSEFANVFARFADTSNVTSIRSREEIVLWQRYTKQLGYELINDVGKWSISSHHVFDPNTGILYKGSGESLIPKAYKKRSTSSDVFLFSQFQTDPFTVLEVDDFFFTDTEDLFVLIASEEDSDPFGMGSFDTTLQYSYFYEEALENDDEPGYYGPNEIYTSSSIFGGDYVPIDSFVINNTGDDLISFGSALFPFPSSPKSYGIYNSFREYILNQNSQNELNRLSQSSTSFFGMRVTNDGRVFAQNATGPSVLNSDGTIDSLIDTTLSNRVPISEADGENIINIQNICGGQVDIGLDNSLFMFVGQNSLHKSDPMNDLSLLPTFCLTEGNYVWKIGIDGRISVIAGLGNNPDAIEAKNKDFGEILGFASSKTSSSVFIVSNLNGQGYLWEINSGGKVLPLAGGVLGNFNIDVSLPVILRTDYNGNIYYYQNDFSQVIKLFSSVTNSVLDTKGGFLIASDSGEELYRFDLSGRHLATTSAKTGEVLLTFNYSQLGNLISIIDSYGNTTTIARDSEGNATSITGPYGEDTTVETDANGYLSRFTNSENEAYEMIYTDGGLITSFTTPRGHTTTMEYDEVGRLLKETDPLGGFKVFSRVELEDGFEVTWTTATGKTKKSKVTEPDSETKILTRTLEDGTIWEREITGRTNYVDRNPSGSISTVRQGLDPRFGISSRFTAFSATQQPSGLTNTMESSRSVTPAGVVLPNELEQISDLYTVNGREYREEYNNSELKIVSSTPEGRTTTTYMDTLHKPILLEVPDLASTEYNYELRGRVSSVKTSFGSEARETVYSYGSDGRVASIIDPIGRTVSLTRDSIGRVISETLFDGRVINYSYDDSGNLVSLTPPGKSAHVFNYDERDDNTQYDAPDETDGVAITSYQYDLDKDLIKVIRPGGIEIDYTRDSAKRVTLETHPEATYNYSYSTATGFIESSSVNHSLFLETQSLNYQYDGDLLTRETSSGSVDGYVENTYNTNYWIISQDVSGSIVNYNYDNDGLLTLAGDLTMNYKASNGLLLGTSLDNITSEMTYNGFAEVLSCNYKYSGSDIFTEILERDGIGRVTKKTIIANGVTTTSKFSYDTAGRLTSVLKDGTETNSYTYDSNSNRLSANLNGVEITGTYDAQDRLISYGENAYTYEPSGELASKTNSIGSTNYTYDEVGNLVMIDLPDGKEILYIHDSNNRRIAKIVDGTYQYRFLYTDQLNPIAEVDDIGNVTTRYIYGDKPNVPSYMIRGGVTYRFVSDYLGSVRMVINSDTGEIVQEIDYDEFGHVISDSNPSFQPFGFVGGIYDSDTGLIRFGARDYDSEIGRWTNKDPILFAGRDSNLYGYVLSDPVNLIDLNGLESWTINFSGGPIAARPEGGLSSDIGRIPDGWAAPGMMEGINNTLDVENWIKTPGKDGIPIDNVVECTPKGVKCVFGQCTWPFNGPGGIPESALNEQGLPIDQNWNFPPGINSIDGLPILPGAIPITQLPNFF